MTVVYFLRDKLSSSVENDSFKVKISNLALLKTEKFSLFSLDIDK